MKKIFGLTLAKAIGILFIIATHVNQIFRISALSFGTPYYPWVDRLFHVFGFYGVSLFLVASGFGITWSLLHKRRMYWSTWFKKRMTKIFTLFWISFIFFLLFFNLGHLISDVIPAAIMGKKEFLLTMLGVQAYVGMWGGSLNPVYWFNSLIIALSILFPILYLIARKVNLYVFLGVTMIMSIISSLVVLHYSWTLFRVFPLDRIFECSVGIALAILIKKGTLRLTHWTTGTTLISLLVIFVFYVTYLGDLATTVLVITGGPLFFIGFLSIKEPSQTSMLQNMIQWLGHHSHALFLFHLPFLMLYTRLFTSVPIFVLVYAIVLILCVVGAEMVAGYCDRAILNFIHKTRAPS